MAAYALYPTIYLIIMQIKSVDICSPSDIWPLMYISLFLTFLPFLGYKTLLAETVLVGYGWSRSL